MAEEGPMRKSRRLEERAGHCPIEQLPPELLMRILSKVDQTSRSRCAQLNRRWNQLAMHPLLWRKIKIRKSQNLRKLGLKAEMPKRFKTWLGDSVREIVAGYWILDKPTSRRWLQSVISSCSNLTSLKLGGHLSESTILTVARCCHRLSELHLIDCDGVLTVESLHCLLSECPALSVLNIDGSSSVFSNWQDQRVRDLFFALVGRLTSLTVEGSVAADLLVQMPECPRLKSLSVYFAPPGCDFLELLSRKTPNLTNLKVNVEISDEPETFSGVPVSFFNLPWLRSLDIGFYIRTQVGFELFPSDLPKLLRGCPSLSMFKFSCHFAVFSSHCYQRLLSAVPKDGRTDIRLSIRKWNLCPSLQDCIGQIQQPIISGLTHLTLHHCEDDLLTVLLAQLPLLRILRLMDCSMLTRQAWASLKSASLLLPDLQEFEARRCCQSSLTNDAVADLCASSVAQGLRRLTLCHCNKLTAATLISIANGCPRLTQLRLCGFRPISRDAEIEAMFEHRVDLSEFWLSV